MSQSRSSKHKRSSGAREGRSKRESSDEEDTNVYSKHTSRTDRKHKREHSTDRGKEKNEDHEERRQRKDDRKHRKEEDHRSKYKDVDSRQKRSNDFDVDYKRERKRGGKFEEDYKIEEGRNYTKEDRVGDRYYALSKPETEPIHQREEVNKETIVAKKVSNNATKTVGAYIPPALLKIMQASITDKSSAEYQRITWEALKKSIHGLINKVNRANIDKIIRQLLKENIVRGRGLLCRSIMQAQAMSTTFSSVYAALVALINSRFPNIGELLLKRLVIQFRRGFKRNDKINCIAAVTFIAHLVNQRIAHEILALEILTLLVENPTNDSIEVAIAFLKECGMKLTEVSSKGVDAIFQMLRNVLHERQSDARSQHMITVMMQIRKDKFKDQEAIPEGLDLVEEEDQFTHLVTLDDATDAQDILNVFKFDPEYLEHEEKYKELSKEIVGESSSDEDGDDEGDDDEDDDDENQEEQTGPTQDVIVDNTETNLVALRRTLYLTIYSSLDFEECAHKLMKMNLKPGQEPEVCAMILDCCCEMRTYERFFGLLAQRFCQVNRSYISPFENLFKDTYQTVHRLKTSQCRNAAKLFAHLLFTDAFSWNVLACIRLNEEDTTSSGRIFIKILFHELSEYMGLLKLNDRLKDITLQEAFAGLFPRDNPRNTRFSINFFTSIGLGGLTDELRDHLKVAATAEPLVLPGIAAPASSPSSGSSSSLSTSDESSSSESDSEPSRKKAKKSTKSKKEKKKKRKKKSSKKHRKQRSSS